MSEAEKIFLCFVRGLNVFGAGRMLLAEQRARCSSACERSDQNIKFLDSYSNTGNFALLGSPEIATETVQRLVRDAFRKPSAVVESFAIGRIALALRLGRRHHRKNTSDGHRASRCSAKDSYPTHRD